MLLSLVSLVLCVAGDAPSPCDLARQWPKSRDAIEAIFARGGPAAARAFYQAVFERRAPSSEDLSWETKRAIASEYARHHTDPRIRALSLGFAGPHDVDLLREAYARDASPLVRIAILRLASFMGEMPGNVDLRKCLIEEKDPEILLHAIQARSVSMCRLSDVVGLELWESFLLARQPSPSYEIARFGRLDTGEIARLDRILAEEKDPHLRDAASRAIALDRAWYLRESKEKLPIETRADLRIHEWGVWFDRGPLLRAAHEAEDLPPFVHLSQTAAADLWDAHSFRPMSVTKPVVYFYCPEPIIVILRATFCRGRPWSFFPEITDYVESVRSRSGFLWDPRQPGDPRPFPGPESFEDRPGLRPSWVGDAREIGSLWPRDLHLPFLGYSVPNGDLRRFYAVAPWVFPPHDVTARRTGSGDRLLAGIGVEWRGLRVGFPPDLEAAPPDAPAGHWWRFLRDVPSAPVAIGGESERFLFYDGSIDIPGPVQIRWTDARKEALRIRVQPFESYPLRGADSRGRPGLPALFLVRVEKGEETVGAIWKDLSPSDPRREIALGALAPVPGGFDAALDETLVSRGLTGPEARALLRTWREDFFAKPGLRAITVIPQWIYDAVLPLEIDPIPGEIVRVGIVVRECDEILVDAMDTVIAEIKAPPDPVAIREGPIDVRTYPVSTAIERGVSLPAGGPLAWDIIGHPTGACISADGNTVIAIDRCGRELRAFDLRPRSRTMAIFPKEAPSLYVLGPVSLSRDGKRIAVELDRSPVVVKRGADSVVQESRSAIAVIDLVSSRMHVLASEKTDHRSPSLSADGRLIAFAASGGGERAVVVADMEAGTARSFDPGGEPVEVAISADGNTLAYSARSTNDLDLFAADLRAGTRHLISDRPGDDSLSSISADGTRVAFAGEVFGDREILLADLRAGTIRDISRREGKDDFPRISADGRRIVFSGLMGESRQLFFADVETGLVKTLSGSDAWDYGPSISGDGKKVLFISGGQIFGTVRFLQVD